MKMMETGGSQTFRRRALFTSGFDRNVKPVRWAVALLVAIASDAASVTTSINVPLQVGVDIVTALLIWAALGWHWVLLVPLIAEALPVVSLFPTWTLVVLALKGAGMLRKTTEGADQMNRESGIASSKARP